METGNFFVFIPLPPFLCQIRSDDRGAVSGESGRVGRGWAFLFRLCALPISAVFGARAAPAGRGWLTGGTRVVNGAKTEHRRDGKSAERSAEKITLEAISARPRRRFPALRPHGALLRSQDFPPLGGELARGGFHTACSGRFTVRTSPRVRPRPARRTLKRHKCRAPCVPLPPRPGLALHHNFGMYRCGAAATHRACRKPPDSLRCRHECY